MEKIETLEPLIKITGVSSPLLTAEGAGQKEEKGENESLGKGSQNLLEKRHIVLLPIL